MRMFRFSFRVVASLLIAVMALGAVMLTARAASKLEGAIFTTNSTCSAVNQKKFADKDAVYLNGGPKKPGAAGLPDGSYYVRVTEPNGTMLGTSVGSGNDKPVQVADGEFVLCYQVSALLIKASDGTPGYDDTTNPGGVYKVWVSSDPNFAPNSSKTKNFKIKAAQIEPPQ